MLAAMEQRMRMTVRVYLPQSVGKLRNTGEKWIPTVITRACFVCE